MSEQTESYITQAEADAYFRSRMEQDAMIEAITKRMSREIDDKILRQLLVQLTKQRAMEMLDRTSDHDMDGVTIILNGTSPIQTMILRRFLSELVVPVFIDTYDDVLSAAAKAEDDPTKAADDPASDDPTDPGPVPEEEDSN